MAQKFKERGLIILGVTKETDIAKIDKFVETMGDKMNYTVAIDINSAVTTGAVRAGQSGLIGCLTTRKNFDVSVAVW